MRITFVLPEASLTGGVRVVSIYAERLRQRGHQVTVISTPPPRPGLRQRLREAARGQGWRRRPTHFDGLPVDHRVIPHPPPVTDADVPDADVVIATWWETVEWVWHLAPAKGIKVHFMQDYEVWDGQVERVDATCRLPIPRIVIAGWVRDLLQRRFGQTPVALIPNSVETGKFFAPPRGKQPIPTVGTAYTGMRNKGTDICLEAFRRAAKHVPQLQFVAFSSFPPLPELPLPKGATFVYRAPDSVLRELYSRCDAWLYGTRIEGFGLPILEAMACRTPVIATPGGAAPELLASGGGLLVNPEDPAAMAEAIVQIAAMDDARWRELSMTAWQTATSYSWEDATVRFEAALLQIGSQSAAPAAGAPARPLKPADRAPPWRPKTRARP